MSFWRKHFFPKLRLFLTNGSSLSTNKHLFVYHMIIKDRKMQKIDAWTCRHVRSPLQAHRCEPGHTHSVNSFTASAVKCCLHSDASLFTLLPVILTVHFSDTVLLFEKNWKETCAPHFKYYKEALKPNQCTETTFHDVKHLN